MHSQANSVSSLLPSCAHFELQRSFLSCSLVTLNIHKFIKSSHNPAKYQCWRATSAESIRDGPRSSCSNAEATYHCPHCLLVILPLVQFKSLTSHTSIQQCFLDFGKHSGLYALGREGEDLAKVPPWQICIHTLRFSCLMSTTMHLTMLIYNTCTTKAHTISSMHIHVLHGTSSTHTLEALSNLL